MTVRWLPFLLRPDEPRDGTPKAPDTPDNRRVGVRLKQAGSSVGIEFTGMTDRSPNTIEAHALLDFALQHEQQGGADAVGLQNRLMEVLFRQYFTDGIYPDAIALRAAAEEVGLNVDAAMAFCGDESNWEVIRKADLGYKQAGIQGVPYFVVNGAGVFSGAQPPTELVTAFEEAYTDSSDEED